MEVVDATVGGSDTGVVGGKATGAEPIDGGRLGSSIGVLGPVKLTGEEVRIGLAVPGGRGGRNSSRP